MKSRKNFPIERQGINYVQSIVENANCRFTEFPKDNDFGVDALVELLYKRETTGKIYAIQIKSGKSYCNKTHCWINAPKKHKEYWKAYPLPVFGIVYDPSEKKGYWINISGELKNSTKTIKFPKSTINIFDDSSFKKWFTPESKKKTQEKPLSFSESVKLAKSNDPIGIHVGMGSLSKNYKDKKETWEILLNYFKTTKAKDIPAAIVYVLSTIPGHHGLWPGASPTDKKLRSAVLKQISNFTKNDIVKLLYPISEYEAESGEFFPRGNTAHCAAILIEQIHNKNEILQSIAFNKRQNTLVRQYALLILAMSLQEQIFPILNDESLENLKLKFVKEYIVEWLSDSPKMELFSQW